MVVFEKGSFSGALAMFLQQGLSEMPRTVRGVFEQLFGELLGVVPALVTALIVFGIFYLIAWVGMRFINYSAPRFKEAGISMPYPTQRILQEVVSKQVDGAEHSAAA